MTRLLVTTALALVLTAGAQARDMFHFLDGKWCDVHTGKSITIVEDAGACILFDGEPGEAPRCMLKRATNRGEPVGDHLVTWRCDPSPPHEPEDRPTPRAKFYDLTERLGIFVFPDSNANRWVLLARARPGKPIELFQGCQR